MIGETSITLNVLSIGLTRGPEAYNAAMRLRFAHIAICSCLLIGQHLTHAQQPTNASPRPALTCPATPQDEPPSGPEIAVSNVTFSGFIQMPISEQEEIVTSIRQQKHSYPLDGVVDEALERVRAGWQNHGYFKVEVNGEAKTLNKTSTDMQIALFVHVDENTQYRLGKITFKNNKAIPSSAKLRDLIPLKDGEIFSRETIAKGLENLRTLYGEFGYINYTGVPETTFDDEKKLAFLEIDIDEGKQFYLTRIDILGLDGPSQREVLKDMRVGQIYNQRLFQLSLERSTPPYSVSWTTILRMLRNTWMNKWELSRLP